MSLLIMVGFLGLKLLVPDVFSTKTMSDFGLAVSYLFGILAIFSILVDSSL